MPNTFEEILERKELREALKLERQRSRELLTIDQWLGSLLRIVWNRFNALTAKHARRYQIRAYLFG